VTALAEADQKRLLALLGMTDSASDNEALTAARKAHALVKKRGLTLTEAIEDMAATEARKAAQALDTARMRQVAESAFERGRAAGKAEAAEAAPLPWRQMRDHALAVCPNLRAREREFLDGLALRFSLTPKQQGWLNDIYSRCPTRATP
jgi:hypothetical protein